MIALSIYAILTVLAELVVPGDISATAINIGNNQPQFYIAIACYIIILILDAIIAWAFYKIFKPKSRKLALLTSGSRLAYTFTMLFFVLALLFGYYEIYGKGELVAYIFFIPHLFILGYVTFKSGYLPKVLGIVLMIASFAYIILTYGPYYIPERIFEILNVIAMVPAFLAERSLGIWLLIRANKLEERIGMAD